LTFAPGSLIITRASNDGPGFDQQIARIASECKHPLTPILSGFVEKGRDLGSDVIRYLRKPRVLLISGEGTSSEAMGEIWHYFEQQISYPVTLVRYSDLHKTKLTDFDVAIFPNGEYEDLPAEKLQNWVREGGKLIAMENTVNLLIDKKGFSIKKKEDKKDDKPDVKSKLPELKTYESRNRDALSTSIPGAIYRVNIDNTHPLGFGLSNYYYTLKLSDDIYDFLADDGWNVGTIKKNGYVSGFVGQKSKQKIKDGLLFGVQSIGRGSVVYLSDDPLFRSFWETGKLLFSNAVFMVGQ